MVNPFMGIPPVVDRIHPIPNYRVKATGENIAVGMQCWRYGEVEAIVG